MSEPKLLPRPETRGFYWVWDVGRWQVLFYEPANSPYVEQSGNDLPLRIDEFEGPWILLEPPGSPAGK